MTYPGSGPAKALVALGFMLMSTVSMKALGWNFLVPSYSYDGEFTISYSGNSLHYVFLIEIDRGTSTVISADSGGQSSNSIKLQKSDGTYGYRLARCRSQTLGYAGGCNFSDVHSVYVNKRSSGDSVDQNYQYDSLGRLTQVDHDGDPQSSYCYDKAGNRVYTLSKKSGDPCNFTDSNDDLDRLPKPKSLSYTQHYGEGYSITWDKVQGASYYVLRLVNNAPDPRKVIDDGDQTVFYTGTSAEIPKWIKACDANGECSSRAYF